MLMDIVPNYFSVDILVQWEDGTKNVVLAKELKVIGGGRKSVGVRVKMWWAPSGKWYKGVVISMAKALHNESDEEDVNEDDGIPLSEPTNVRDINVSGQADGRGGACMNEYR